MGERNMDIERMAALMRIGELALQLHQAQNCVPSARTAYHEKLRIEGFETRPDPHAEEGTEARAAVDATATEYAALKRAQRATYNIKRRLDNACRKLA